MNENLNLVEILKDCPKGTKLYSTIFGEVKFVDCDNLYQIIVTKESKYYCFTSEGAFIFKNIKYNLGECSLFPSKDQRDWSKFELKFNPNTLKPFDKVLVRDDSLECWEAQLFSHIIKDDTDFPYVCTNDSNRYCIPYNEETKHLVGTSDEAPEFYSYWEE